jgi:hypothetical protein
MYDAPDNGSDWRTTITPELENFGLNVLDPCKKTIHSEIGQDKEYFKKLIMEEKFLELKEKFFPILKLDLRCVDLSHFIILMYRPSLKTIGTIHEIVMANIEKKPILMYYPKEELAEFNPWMACLIKPNHFFSKWEDMFNYLKQVDSGIFDTSLWY